MATGQSSSRRAMPVGGVLEDLAMWRFEDVVDGSTDTTAVAAGEKKVGQNLVVKAPAQFLKIATQVSALARDYPYDGSTAVTVAGSSGTTVKLATTAVPVMGALLVLLDGGAGFTGEVRRIQSVSGTDVVVNRVYSGGNVPSSTNYRQLVPAFLRTRLLLKAELSTNGGNDYADLLIKYFAFPRTADATPLGKAPECYIEGPIRLANLQLAGDTVESSYYHLTSHARDCEGAIGWKARLVALPAGLVTLLGCTV